MDYIKIPANVVKVLNLIGSDDFHEEEVMNIINTKNKILSEELTDELNDNIDTSMYREESDLGEIVADILNRDKIGVKKIEWEYYSGRNNKSGIVKNVKGKGFPDWDIVIEKAAKELKVSEEAVRDYCTDEFLDQLFWEDINFQIENQDVSDPYYYIVTGRSGGYQGLMYDGDFIEIDEDQLKKEISKFLKNYKYDSNDFDFSVSSSDMDMYGIVFDGLFDKLDDLYGDNEKKVMEVLKLQDDAKKAFKKTGDYIENSIKDMEEPDRWVEEIVINENYTKNFKE